MKTVIICRDLFPFQMEGASVNSKTTQHLLKPLGLGTWLQTPVDTTLFYLILAAAGFMAVIIPMDQSLTLWFHRHQCHFLSDFMGRTLFEGDWIGSGDLSIFLLIIVLGVYTHVMVSKDSGMLWYWRPQLGFILISAFWSCLGNIHTLKWIIGRARPISVLHEGLSYSSWFELGPHFVTQGIYRGSFPSGHTAVAFIFMALAYVLAGDARHDRRTRLLGASIGIFAIVNALAMTIARCMSLRHWASDSLASIFFAWITIHLLYYHILRLPDLALDRSNYKGPRFWELRLCLYQAVMLVGFLAIMIGLRAIIEQDGVFLAAIIPMSLVACRYFWHRSLDVWRKAMRPSSSLPNTSLGHTTHA